MNGRPIVAALLLALASAAASACVLVTVPDPAAPPPTPTLSEPPAPQATPAAQPAPGATPTPAAGRAPALRGLPDVASVVEAVAPSVVLVRSTVETTDSSGRTSTGFSRGSGVVFDPRGYIITNRHVVEDAVKVDVVFSDGQPVNVVVVGSDAATDMAVLRMDPEFVDDGLVVTPIGDSEAARVGDWVIAIGNPLGFEGSVTVGVISAKDRSLQLNASVRLQDLIQTDAVINPGNSGGPLLNMEGEVVGINTAIIRGALASGQEAEGIGFAVAATTVVPVARRIIEDGRVIWPRVGISIDDVDPILAAERGLSVDRGVLVVSLADGGPAQAGGVEVGDVIVAVDEAPITKFTDLRRLMLNRYRVGDTVTLRVVRAAVTLEFDVTLDELVF